MAKGVAAIFKGAGVVAIIVLVCKMLGFVEKLVVGKIYQTSYEADVYFAAFIFLIVFHEFAKGIAQPFLPVMSDLKERIGEAEAWKLFSVLANLVLVPFLVISITVIIFAGPIAEWFYSSDKPTKVAVHYDEAQKSLSIYPVQGLYVVDKKNALAVDSKAKTAVRAVMVPNTEQGDGPKNRLQAEIIAEGSELSAETIEQLKASGWFAPEISKRQMGGLLGEFKKDESTGVITKEVFAEMTKPVTLEQKINLLALLIKIMFIGAAFLGLSAFTYLLLNSEKRFLAPALGDLTFKVLGLVGLLALVPIGMGIHGGAIGVAAGGIGYLLVNIIALWKKRSMYRATLNIHYKPLTDTLKLMTPLVFYMVFYLGRQFVDIYYSLPVEGGFSSLQYSYKLIEFPHRTLLEPFAIAIFPTLSLLAAAQKDGEFADLLQLGLRAVCLLFIPAATCLFVTRHEAIALLWPGFPMEHHFFTAIPLGLYAFAMIPLALDIVITKALIAKKDTWSPAIFELVAAGIHIGVIVGLRNYAGAVGLGDFIQTYPHAPIALGFTLSRLAKFVLMYLVVNHRIKELKISADLAFLAKVGISFAAMLAAMWFARDFGAEQWGVDHSSGRIKNGALLMGISLMGVVIFYAGVLGMRVTELQEFIKLLKDRKKKKTADAESTE